MDHWKIGAATWVATLCMLVACSESNTVEPVTVPPADSEVAETSPVDTLDPQDAPVARVAETVDVGDADAKETVTPRRPGADDVEGGGVWVVDSAGQDVGALVRRGSDDNQVYRAIYDLVTVYHPSSGLFFEITMTDALVRYPSNTFFSTADCQGPVGIGHGGCSDCRSGPGTALLHAGVWYRVTAGVTFEVTTAGSTMGSGMSGACSSHHTDSAKIYPVTEVSGSAPPTTFTPPLHFAWK